MLPPQPANEAERLAALDACGILDTLPEDAFDRITKMAARLFDVPIALVSLVDAERQWFKSCVGTTISETSRDVAFCGFAILEDDLLIVPDARQDERFAKNPLVTGPAGIRFYAGAPVRSGSGLAVGTLCIIDTKPRELGPEQQATLRDLAAVVSDELERRGTSGEKLARIERGSREVAEHALRASQARGVAIFQAALDGIVMIDHEGRIQEFNPAVERIFGTSRAQAVGQLLHEFIASPALREAHLRVVARDDASNDDSLPDRRIEVRARHSDGRKILIEVAITRIPIEGSTLFAAHLRDITERRAAEGQLRMLQSSVLNANDVILITEAEPISGPGPRIIYVNKAFTEHTGYTADEVLGKTPRILQGPNTTVESKRAIRAALEAWKPIRIEVLNYKKDGTEFWSELNIVPVANAKGWFTHWVSVQREITESRHARLALEQARDEAERANRAKSDFLSRMSHELRTPLNAILGFSQLLQNAPLATRDKKGIDQIVKAGWHLLNLINGVLDVARIESGKLELSLEPVWISEVIREARELVSPLAAAAQVELIESECDSEAHWVVADRQRLKQALLNLLSNGIKYNHAGGKVTISCHAAAAARLQVEVRDTGPGITPEDLGKLFAPFERLGAPNEIEGSGLGLALSRRLIEAMGGTLTVGSTLGEGCLFSLQLPLAERGVAAAQLENGSTEARAVAPPTVATLLYIEDNLVNVQLIEMMLAERPGVKLVPAMQGRLGLELARKHRPDVILLDLHLPDLDGHEVLRRLRLYPETQKIPVIIVSADATPQQIERMRSAGAIRYVTKPFDVKTFLATLDELLPGAPAPLPAEIASPS